MGDRLHRHSPLADSISCQVAPVSQISLSQNAMVSK